MARQQADIVFGPFQEGSYEELGGASPRAINVVIDPKGVVSKRPGIAAYSVAPPGVVDADGITGLYADNTGQLFAVGGTPDARHIYKLLNGAAADLSLATNSTLRGRLRPTFAETEVFLVMAGGSDPQKLHLQTLVSTQLGGEPPVASHIVANSSRLAANDIIVDKTKVRFSGVFQGTVDISLMENWDNDGQSDHGGFFTAEARPDPVQAVHENTNEIFVWGKDNVQIFTPDATSIFAPTVTREAGTLAPYSIIKQGQDFFWLDQHRRIVYSDGRSFQNLEGPIKAQLDALSNPSDCFGYRVFTGHVDCLVWTFPTDGRTFAYQIGGGWSEWFGWDDSQANFKRFIVNAHHLRRDGGLNVVGTTDGRIGQLSLSTFDDRGEKVVAYVESGFVNRETDYLKKCCGVKFAIRRGSNSAASLGRVEWRDDTGPWNGPIYIDTGTTGDNHCVREIRSLGNYRRRQWRWTFSDTANLSLLKVTESFEVLGS
jgi:hypothetical protein